MIAIGTPPTLAFTNAASRTAHMLASASERLHQAIEIFESLVERLHGDSLVAAVRAVLAHLGRQPRVAVGRYSRISQERAVGGTRRHRGNDRRAGPELG